MPLTVVTPAATVALTTLDAVKPGLDVGDGDDAALTDLIGQASAAIVTYTGRTFGREVVQEVVRLHRPVTGIVLERAPVVSVSAVMEGAATLSTTDYEADLKAGIVRRLSSSGCYRTFDAGTVTVSYTAGWLLPGEDGRDLPADIEGAAVALVRHLWNERGAWRGLQSVALGSSNITYRNPASGVDGGMPGEIASALDRWQLPVVG